MQSASLNVFPYDGLVGLELGKPTQDDLSAGQTRDYSVEIELNQYIRAIGADG